MTLAATEAAVIGAGPAGLVTALALARLGINTIVVGPAYSIKRVATDRRTTALIGPSIELLKNLDVWPICVHEAAPISAVRIVGTDIAHAVPLTLAAGLGHVWLGNVDWILLAGLLAGSLPGVMLGSYIAGKLPEHLIRYSLITLLVFIGGRFAVR